MLAFPQRTRRMDWSLMIGLALLISCVIVLYPLAAHAAAAGTRAATGSTATPLYGNTNTVLPNGQVLAAGGSGFNDQNSGFYATTVAELYNPATNTWQATGNMNVTREFAGAGALADGRVLVAGGITPIGATGNVAGLASAELYNPTTGIWAATGSMSTVRYAQTATVLDSGQVLVTGNANGVISGGSGGATVANTAEVYTP